MRAATTSDESDRSEKMNSSEPPTRQPLVRTSSSTNHAPPTSSASDNPLYVDYSLSTTTPDGTATLRTWNIGGLLETVQVQIAGAGSPTDLIRDIDYDEHGRRTLVQYAREAPSAGDGTKTEYGYDPLSRRLISLVSTKSVQAGGVVVQDFAYWYDAVGNLVEVTDAASPTTYFDNTAVTPERRYTYDAIYRLVTATGREHASLLAATSESFPTWQGLPDPTADEALRRYTETYTYDRAGNITQLAHSSPAGPHTSANNWTRGYTYEDGGNRLDEVQIGTAPADVYAHDEHGNLRAMPHMPNGAGSDFGMVWDAGDRLQRTRHGSGAFYVYYQYDAAGRRVRKVVENSSGDRFKETVYFGEWERWRKYQAGGVTLDDEEQSLHVADDRRRFALVEARTVIATVTQTSPVWVTRYQLGDHLGSASVELGSAEETLTFEEYHPYGTTSHRGQSSSNPGWSRKRYRWTGQERDEESGLSYHHHRYYAPWLARWTRPDPAGLSDGVNRYAYVGGSPAGRIDPSGLQGDDDDADHGLDGDDDAPMWEADDDDSSAEAPRTVDWLSEESFQRFTAAERQFIQEIDTWVSEQIEAAETTIESEKERYARKNWAFDENTGKAGVQKRKIARLRAARDSLGQALEAGAAHPADLFNLAGIVQNEAANSNQDAKVAVAYAWLNRTGGAAQAPTGAQISHYQTLAERWSGATSADRMSLLETYSASITAASTRLGAEDPAATDPTSGATHWVSPRSLSVFREAVHGRTRYSRTVGNAADRAFPLWARATNAPEVAEMQARLQLADDFEEITVTDVAQEQFLFYRGVR